MNIFFLEWIALSGRGGTEKCSSVIPDESLFDIPTMSEAVVKPVTLTMLLLLEKMTQCWHWKVKVGTFSGKLVLWKRRTSRRCQRLAANPENGVWWRQICWKMICFRAEAWMCHNHCGRKYSGFRAYAAKLLKLMPCDYTGNSVLGVVWSVATPLGKSFTYLHFIGSFYTVCFMSINCTLSEY